MKSFSTPCRRISPGMTVSSTAPRLTLGALKPPPSLAGRPVGVEFGSADRPVLRQSLAEAHTPAKLVARSLTLQVTESKVPFSFLPLPSTYYHLVASGI